MAVGADPGAGLGLGFLHALPVFLLLGLAQGLGVTGFKGFPTGPALRVELFGRQLGDEATATLGGVLVAAGILISFLAYLGTVFGRTGC